MTIEEFYQMLDINSMTIGNNDFLSLNLAIELHYKYRIQGFKPQEFYFYITGLSSPHVYDWSDAVIKVKNFIDEKEFSNAIH